MTVMKNSGQWDRSNVVFRPDGNGTGGEIVKYDKKEFTEEMEYIDYGLGVFRRKVFEDLEEDKVIDLADIYKNLLIDNELAGFEVKKRFYEIGSFKGIEETKQYLGGLNGSR